METEHALISFSPALRPLLAPGQREMEAVPVAFKGAPAVKHLVEALGIPHTEVGELRINGLQASLGDPLQPGDRVDVLAPGAGNGASPPDEPRFVADNHLGRLAAYLRMLGFDTLYRNDYQDPELAYIASQQERILLTRDRRLLMRKVVQYGYCLRSLEPREQLDEVARRYNLLERAQPFRRCLKCNHLLEKVEKSEVIERLLPLTRRYYDEFAICPACQQIYWKGSHFEHMQNLIDEML